MSIPFHFTSYLSFTTTNTSISQAEAENPQKNRPSAVKNFFERHNGKFIYCPFENFN